MPELDAEKRLAATAAVKEIRDGMIVGLGTGSTAAFAIEALAARCRQGLKIRAVATSIRTDTLARKSGITMLDFADFATVDLCIDGVDEIDPAFRAIKGAGGAMLREKIVARSAARMIAVADHSKAVSQLGRAPVPVEFAPFAKSFLRKQIESLGGSPVLRRSAYGDIVLTDQHNPIFDCSFDEVGAPEELAARLSQVPGVLAHGLFIGEIDALYIATGDLLEIREAISGRQ